MIWGWPRSIRMIGVFRTITPMGFRLPDRDHQRLLHRRRYLAHLHRLHARQMQHALQLQPQLADIQIPQTARETAHIAPLDFVQSLSIAVTSAAIIEIELQPVDSIA